LPLNFLIEQTQHIPKLVKDGGDTLSLGGILLYFTTALTPYLEFIVLALTAIWFFLRIIDFTWSLRDRWKNRKTKKKGL
jgi:hypothetical protein